MWNDFAFLAMKWSEYKALFDGERRVELLNNVAPMFFVMIENVLWRDILLHIARILDKTETRAGKQKFQNSTVQCLPELVSDPKIKEELEKSINATLTKAEFRIDWRNRHIAHNDSI